jgi:hypothetical protein
MGEYRRKHNKQGREWLIGEALEGKLPSSDMSRQDRLSLSRLWTSVIDFVKERNKVLSKDKTHFFLR